MLQTEFDASLTEHSGASREWIHHDSSSLFYWCINLYWAISSKHPSSVKLSSSTGRLTDTRAPPCGLTSAAHSFHRRCWTVTIKDQKSHQLITQGSQTLCNCTFNMFRVFTDSTHDFNTKKLEHKYKKVHSKITAGFRGKISFIQQFLIIYR